MHRISLTRRTLMRRVLHTLAVAPIFGAVWQASKSVANAAQKLVDPRTDAMARALKYIHDPLKEATDPRTEEKQGVPGIEQLCNNCQLYTKTGELDGHEVGRCTMIPAGVVRGEGWCASWIKMANYVPKSQRSGGEAKPKKEEKKKVDKKKEDKGK